MGKFKFVLSVLVYLLFFNVNYCSSQGNISMVTSSNDDVFDLIDELNDVNDSQLEIVRDVDLRALELDFDAKVDENFGMYINPYSNSIKIKSSNNFNFNKVQVTNTKTGEVLNMSNVKGNEVDLTSVESGNYKVILTDDKNNIHSEIISVVKLTD